MFVDKQSLRIVPLWFVNPLSNNLYDVDMPGIG